MTARTFGYGLDFSEARRVALGHRSAMTSHRQFNLAVHSACQHAAVLGAGSGMTPRADASRPTERWRPLGGRKRGRHFGRCLWFAVAYRHALQSGLSPPILSTGSALGSGPKGGDTLPSNVAPSVWALAPPILSRPGQRSAAGKRPNL